MTMHVEVTVTVEGADRLSTHHTVSRAGDNPRYRASQARSALLEIAGRVDKVLTGVYGDAEAGVPHYVAPLS